MRWCSTLFELNFRTKAIALTTFEQCVGVTPKSIDI
jgi:hypothetical protein